MSDKRTTVWVQHFKDRPHLVLQWLDPDTGRRKSKSAKTADPREAERARGDLEADLNHGRHKEASRMTWEAFRDLYEAEYLTGKRPATQKNHRAALDLFEKLCNPRTLRGVTERTVSLFAAGMRQNPGRSSSSMAVSSIHVYLQNLHTALNWAVGQKFIAEVPRFPAIKLPKKKPQAVPTESFERLVDVAPDQQTLAYLLCGWLAGLRLREAFLVEWEPTDAAPYIDLARDRIVLPAELVKGVEDQWVPLDPVLRAALEALPGPREGRVFYFPSREGGSLTVGGLSQRIIGLAKRAGVRLTMKSLRRGFGCRYAGKVPAQVLQKLMRHSDIKITMDYYANVDDAVEAAVLGEKRQRNSSRNKASTVEGETAANQANNG